MGAPAPVVRVYLPGSTALAAVFSAQLVRGRTSPLFTAVDPGTGEFGFNNENRAFDPLYSSSPYFGEIVPGRRATLTAGGVSIFDGFVADWNYDYEGKKSNARARIEDGLARLARTEFDEWTATNGDLPGERITAALARPEVDYTGTTAIDDGLTVLQGDLVTWGSNVLNYLQLVTLTDEGLLFIDRTGVLTFLDRHAFIGVTPAVTLGTGGIEFAAITTSYGSELLYNRVLVDREGGEVQSVSDATSISDYGGVFTLNESGLLMQSDTEALDLATYLLSVYKDPLYRFESVTINVHGLPSSEQTDVLELDIGSVVSVTWTPNRLGSAITRTCIVEGIRHSLAPAWHSVELTLNDSTVAQTGNFWIVEDATYGGFDGSGVMEYPVAF